MMGKASGTTARPATRAASLQAFGRQTRCAASLCVVLLFASACSEDEAKAPIYLGADPASLVVGESIVAELTASARFFTEDVSVPMTSDGGLVIEAISVEDPEHALATISSTADTAIGVHRFTISAGGATATLDLSALAEPAGQGTVTATANTATAGAKNALFEIVGSQTHFDNEISVEVEGAPGFSVSYVDVLSEATIQITYDIALDQEATEATVRIVDGAFAYKVQFTIVSPLALENAAAEQVLTKGRAGWITLSHPEAAVDSGTRFEGYPEGIESGEAQIIDANEVAIPVRVPFDYEADVVELTAFTYSQGGAHLELITTAVTLRPPAWIAASPSVLASEPGSQEVILASSGLDLSALEALTLAGEESLSLGEWEAADATSGTASIVVSAGAESGAYAMTADDGLREVGGLVAYGTPAAPVSVGDAGFVGGDHGFVPLVSTGMLFAEDTVDLLGDEVVQVVGWTYVDERCVVAEVEIAPTASAGTHELTLGNGSASLPAMLFVHEPVF